MNLARIPAAAIHTKRDPSGYAAAAAGKKSREALSSSSAGWDLGRNDHTDEVG